MRIPKTLGAKIDLVLRLRNERLAIERKGKDLKKQEAELSELVLADLKKSRLEKASGKTATFSYATQKIGKVADWGKFYEWIAKTGNFDLLERRVSHGNYRQHLENGERVPGLETDQVVKISLTKL